MTTSIPLVLNETTGNPGELPSANTLGGINTLEFATSIDGPSWFHNGDMEIQPSLFSDLTITLASGAMNVDTFGGTGIFLIRGASSEGGSRLISKTGSTNYWEVGQLAGDQKYHVKNSTTGTDSFSIDDSTNVMTIAALAATNAVLTTPNIGVPSAGTLTNCTGLPVSSGISGLGTGVATALGVNVGSAGAFVVNGGALGTPGSGTVTNLTGTASININGTVGATTPAAGTFTDLTVNGNSILGDAAADTVTMNAQTITCPLFITFSKTAQASVAETLCKWTVSDDTSSSFSIVNGSATDATFTPKFQGVQSGTGVACNFTGQGTTDSGTSPLLIFQVQIGSSTPAATRPNIAFRSVATDMAQFTPGLNFAYKGGSTTPSVDAAAADTVATVGFDVAAGDRQLYARTEANQLNRLTGLGCRVASDFSKTNDTTLANVTGLTRNVAAGEVYAFRAVLFTTSNVGGGVKFAIGGTATATSIIAEAMVEDGTAFATLGTRRVTALGTTFGDVTAVTTAIAIIEGEIIVNAAGTLTVQFAQNASNGTASKVLAGSYFRLISIGS